VDAIGIFIAVVAILAVMDGFFFLILWGMVATVRRFARNNALRQAGILDELVFNKETTLQDLDKKIAAKRALLESNLTAPLKEGTSTALEAPDYQALSIGFYKDADFINEYRTLRENFVFDSRQVVQKVLEKIPSTVDPRAAVAQSILDQMSAEDVYQLSTLETEDQLRLLKEEFNGDQRALLDEYMGTETYFECYEFISWLRQYVFEKGPGIAVRTSHEQERFDSLDERIQTSYDDTLCEGLTIRANGRLYDFSIQNREIVG
jgi:hypothetical protein